MISYLSLKRKKEVSEPKNTTNPIAALFGIQPQWTSQVANPITIKTIHIFWTWFRGFLDSFLGSTFSIPLSKKLWHLQQYPLSICSSLRFSLQCGQTPLITIFLCFGSSSREDINFWCSIRSRISFAIQIIPP